MEKWEVFFQYWIYVYLINNFACVSMWMWRDELCIILIDWSTLKDSGAEEIPRGEERYNAMS